MFIKPSPAITLLDTRLLSEITLLGFTEEKEYYMAYQYQDSLIIISIETN